MGSGPTYNGYDNPFFRGGVSQEANQAAIDAAIKKQLEAQNASITNDIVRQSANVPYRDPRSYFQGFSGAPYMQSAQGNNSLPMARNAKAFVNMPSASPQQTAESEYQKYLAQLMQQYNLLG